MWLLCCFWLLPESGDEADNPLPEVKNQPKPDCPEGPSY